MSSFKGKNTITLNHASLVEAVQMYFDSKFAANKAPKVTQVKRLDGFASEFMISIEEPTAPVATPTAEPSTEPS